MKREEKNLQSRQKIIESALREFAEKGYGLSSINAICESGGIAKGVMYHYYKDKDNLYLTCIRECFDALTAHLNNHAEQMDGDAQSRLTAYFDTRIAFFRENPCYQRLFFEAILAPPAHLSAAITECKAEFDDLNSGIFAEILDCIELCPGMTKQEVVETFRQYQDFINATTAPEDTALHEERARRAVRVLLYGVARREEGER